MKKLITLLLSFIAFASIAQVGLEFDGAIASPLVNCDRIATAYPGIAGSNARTVECWFKRRTTGVGQLILVEWGNTTLTDGRFTLKLISNKIVAEVGSAGSLTGPTIITSTTTWYHVAVTHDPTLTSNKTKIYLNGVLEIQGDIPVNTVLAGTMVIGSRLSTGASGFAGMIDEVRVWDVARTQAEILATKDVEICNMPSSLKSYFRLNDGVPGGTNTGMTSVVDRVTPASVNTLTGNFALTGTTTSNFLTGQVVSSDAPTTQVNVTTCMPSYTWPENGQTYTTSGIKSVTYTTAAGCDSVKKLNLTIAPVPVQTQNVTLCGTYTWVQTGLSYSTSGTYTKIWTNAAGCDSTFQLNLTIISAYTFTPQTTTACESYTWAQDGVTYTNSGTYFKHYTSVQGCDSVYQLDLTIVNTNLNVTTTANSLSAAQSGATYKWLDCNNSSAVLPFETGQTFLPGVSGLYAVQITNGVCGIDTSACTPIVIPAHANVALNFDGTNDGFVTNSLGVLANNQRTVEAWIKVPVSNTVAQHVIVDWGNASPNGTKFAFCVSNNKLKIDVGNVNLAGVALVNDNLWHHVAVTYNPANGDTLRMYLDGVLDVKGKVAIAVNTGSTNPVTFGKRVDNVGFFLGSIDEVRVWNVARTQAEIQANMNNEMCTVTSGLIVYYNMNDGIPAGNNLTAGNTKVYDNVNLTKSGSLPNLTLNGQTSNFVVGKNLTPGMKRAVQNQDACGTYTWPLNGTVYSASTTTPFARTTAVSGCDSIVNLRLNIYAATAATQTKNHCGNYTWPLNGQEYTASGTYTDTIPNSHGCDSIVTLELTITPIAVQQETVTKCGPYMWPQTGLTYSTSGTYTKTYTNALGCDSTFELHLTIAPIPVQQQTLTNCGPYTWSQTGLTYSTSGTYTRTFTNAEGCDSTFQLDLTVSTILSSTTNVTTCGSPYTWTNGTTYTVSGTHTQTLTSAVGCDSIATLNLTINTPSSSTTTIVACGSYTWTNGTNYTASGIHTQTLTNSVGCDSIATLNLTIKYPSASTTTITACGSYTWTNGTNYTASGIHTQTLTNAVGCDSIATLNLTINAPSSSTTTITACGSYTWTNGTNYTVSGIHTQTLTNAVGCDSIATLNLTINAPSSSTTTITACGSYTWTNGTNYTVSGIHTQTLTNAVGCDSIATLNLTIKYPSASTTTITACGSYTWTNGTNYTVSGIHTQTLTNAVGCDSIATLNLTINAPSSSTTTITACGSYTWTNGTNYTASGIHTQTLTNAAGCDSIATLNLTINAPSSSTTTITACGSYTWTNGTNYTVSGIHTQTLTNAAGCDSIATLNLTVTTPSSSEIDTAVCESYTYNGTTYTASGVYMDTLTNAAGCDSIVTINLTIIGVPNAAATDNDDLTITASAGAAYQWIHCATELPIAGAIAQTYTATVNGIYAVVVTNAGGCSDTSNCVTIDYIGIDELTDASIRLFPNPTDNDVTVTMSSANATIEVVDAKGKLLQKITVKNGEKVDLSIYETGIYFLRIRTDNGSATERIVKN